MSEVQLVETRLRNYFRPEVVPMHSDLHTLMADRKEVEDAVVDAGQNNTRSPAASRTISPCPRVYRSLWRILFKGLYFLTLLLLLLHLDTLCYRSTKMYVLEMEK